MSSSRTSSSAAARGRAGASTSSVRDGRVDGDPPFLLRRRISPLRAYQSVRCRRAPGHPQADSTVPLAAPRSTTHTHAVLVLEDHEIPDKSFDVLRAEGDRAMPMSRPR
jgi:hypothetical protein